MHDSFFLVSLKTQIDDMLLEKVLERKRHTRSHGNNDDDSEIWISKMNKYLN